MSNYVPKKIILLNPPADKMIQRDHYCATTSKTDYYWAPIDLLVHSGMHSAHHNVIVIDAMVEKLPPEETITRIINFEPDFIITLSSILSFQFDLGFISECRNKIQFKSIFLGEVFYFNYNVLIEHPSIDAILMQNPSAGLLNYIEGLENCADVIYKIDNKKVIGNLSSGQVTIGTPNHALFPTKKYKIPYTQNWPFVPVVTSFSCPMACSYCPVQGIPSRERSVDELLAEFYQIKKLGIKEILMADLMFNGNILRAKEICRQMIKEKFNFTWFTFMRPDKYDAELLLLMKQAGCHTISFGVESTDLQILKSNRRNMGFQNIENTFSYCNSIELRTMIIILIGLPGENKISIKKTINYICKLKAHYLSVNLFVPRNGSKYMTHLTSLDDIKLDYDYLDSTNASLSYCDLSVKELHYYRSYAQIKFYLNPFRIYKILVSIKTFTELKTTILSGLDLLLK